MSYKRGDICYIVESNYRVIQCKIMNKQGKYYVIQLVGTCGAIRLPESRLFSSNEEATDSIKAYTKEEIVSDLENVEYIDVYKGERKNKNPHLMH